MVSPRDTSSFAHFRKKTKYFDMLTIDTEKSCLRLLNPSPHSQSLIHESQEPAGKSFQRHHFWCTTYLCLKIQVFIPSSTKQFWQKSQCKSYLGWMKMTVWMTYPKSSPKGKCYLKPRDLYFVVMQLMLSNFHLEYCHLNCHLVYYEHLVLCIMAFSLKHSIGTVSCWQNEINGMRN